jgi:hypothetical protein
MAEGSSVIFDDSKKEGSGPRRVIDEIGSGSDWEEVDGLGRLSVLRKKR